MYFQDGREMSDKIEFGILGNIHEESEAVTEYRKLAKVARKAKMPKVAKLFTHIANEEKHHKTELKKMLKKVEHK